MVAHVSSPSVQKFDRWEVFSQELWASITMSQKFWGFNNRMSDKLVAFNNKTLKNRGLWQGLSILKSGNMRKFPNNPHSKSTVDIAKSLGFYIYIYIYIYLYMYIYVYIYIYMCRVYILYHSISTSVHIHHPSAGWTFSQAQPRFGVFLCDGEFGEQSEVSFGGFDPRRSWDQRNRLSGWP